MKGTRFLSLLLASLTLTSFLTACATDTDNPADTDPAFTQAPLEEGETELRDNLPDGLNYNGEEINFYSFYEEGMTSGQVAVPELNSNPVNDAVFERNKLVESRLGVKIVNDDDKSGDAYHVVNKTVTLVQSGSTDYDAITSPCWVVLDQSISGTFSNLTGSEYLDLSQPWWTQDFNEACSFQGNQYAASGHLLLGIYRSAYATVFNKDLFTDVNQPYLYGYVDNGTWTLDKQAALVPLLHRDNGNGLQDEEGDIYGFVSNDFISVDPYWAACEIDILSKDEDGDYIWVFDSGVMHNAAEKILNLFFNTDGGTFCFPEDDSFQTMTRTMFAEGYAAMATLCIHALENSALRNMTDEYGVVPMPKYDENQADYHSQMHDAFTIACIPTTVKGERLEQMAAFLEAMSSASYRIVRPDYYETTLRTKIAQDPQSSEMMDIIINNIHIDAGIIYSHNIGSFHQGIQALVEGKTNNAVSRFKSMSKSAQNYLVKLVKKLDQQ